MESARPVLKRVKLKTKAVTRVAEIDADLFFQFLSFYTGRTINIVSLELTLKKLCMRVFRMSRRCPLCGIVGSKVTVEKSKGNKRWHLALYAERNGEEIRMTVDHILPRSKSGKDCLDNLQPMCEPCNLLKGNSIELLAKLQ